VLLNRADACSPDRRRASADVNAGCVCAGRVSVGLPLLVYAPPWVLVPGALVFYGLYPHYQVPYYFGGYGFYGRGLYGYGHARCGYRGGDYHRR
jgi:hypothetical protein